MTTVDNTPHLPSPKRKRSTNVLPSRTRLRTTETRPARSPQQGSNEDVRCRFQDLELDDSESRAQVLSRGAKDLTNIVPDSEDERFGLVTPPSPMTQRVQQDYANARAQKHGSCYETQGMVNGEGTLMATPPSSPSPNPAPLPSQQAQAQPALEDGIQPILQQTSPSPTTSTGNISDPSQTPLPSSPPGSSPISTQPQTSPAPDLFWSFSEITGHLPPNVAADPQDDGTGINGVGFVPTPAMAARRAKKRKQQVMDWRRREETEARARRSEERARRLATRRHDLGEGMDMGAGVEGREMGKRVRFAVS